ncbi:MAG: 3-dehydroquinate synthase [Clostridia bacterium]|nr:3-dehydroquinate synthase [Clostridia bacterium]
MNKVTVNASKKYDIVIGAGLLRDAGQVIKNFCRGGKVFTVSDDNVFPLYGEALRTSVRKSGLEHFEFVFKAGEASKNLSVYSRIVENMCAAGLTRGDVAVALGGGIAGDITGFAAATYRRGIAFVQVPTSLLADVDSSVGGKTAVDLDNGKNQVGAFWQPSAVICDTDTLKTLPEEEYRNGCAEIIKYGMLGDRDLFYKVKNVPVRNDYSGIITRCVEMKRDIVERDEFESGDRMLLNLGHTFGHAVEKLSGFSIAHGKAVAIGMNIITTASVNLGLAPKGTETVLREALLSYGLPLSTTYGADEICRAAAGDKKTVGESITLVVPTDVGSCRLIRVPVEDLKNYALAGGLK